MVEYALLATVVALAVVTVFQLLTGAIGTTYGSWHTSVNNLWEPPAPGSGS